MRRAVLFIISAFIFSACAHHVTDKEFKHFTNEMVTVVKKNEAVSRNHLKLTKENMDGIEVLKKQLIVAETQIYRLMMVDSMAMRQFGRLYQSLAVLLRALENKGVKLDLEKAQKQLEEEVTKKLQEKSK